ncbi:MAG: hypothetical protein OXR66_01765 [Candidatus Woesearchaeota archaeon]|nr:hypothetical protein [Candidatus Woesearchaeota archaeon]
MPILYTLSAPTSSIEIVDAARAAFAQQGLPVEDALYSEREIGALQFIVGGVVQFDGMLYDILQSDAELNRDNIEDLLAISIRGLAALFENYGGVFHGQIDLVRTASQNPPLGFALRVPDDDYFMCQFTDEKRQLLDAFGRSLKSRVPTVVRGTYIE